MFASMRSAAVCPPNSIKVVNDPSIIPRKSRSIRCLPVFLRLAQSLGLLKMPRWPLSRASVLFNRVALKPTRRWKEIQQNYMVFP